MSEEQFFSTRWENIKNRAEYLRKQSTLFRPLLNLGIALCEELDRLEERIAKLEAGRLPTFEEKKNSYQRR